MGTAVLHRFRSGNNANVYQNKNTVYSYNEIVYDCENEQTPLNSMIWMSLTSTILSKKKDILYSI